MLKKIILASPRGPCAGVERALFLAEQAIEKQRRPLYINHELVHNSFVVNKLKQAGVIFEADLSKIPTGAWCIFSAHGVAPNFYELAKKRELNIIDATCPLVRSVHEQAKKLHQQKKKIIYIGHQGHQETMAVNSICDMQIVISVMEAEDFCQQNQDNKNIAILTQTTLSIEESNDILAVFKKYFPYLAEQKNICYATSNRQKAVQELSQKVDKIIIIGSENSSNSKRLLEIALGRGLTAILLDNPDDLSNEFLKNTQVLGISSGASVPEELTKKLIHKLQNFYPNIIIEELRVAKENISFL